jgi:hypothetical protein
MTLGTAALTESVKALALRQGFDLVTTGQPGPQHGPRSGSG